MRRSISKRITLPVTIALVPVALLVMLTARARPASLIVVNPGDSIQAAIDGANSGDTILIHAGVYTESVTLNKAVSLIGDDRAATIIAAITQQRALTITGASISTTGIISGLTFTQGDAADNGGGVLITGTARPVLQNLIVAGNQAGGSGGGIYAANGSPVILVDVDVISNTANGTVGTSVGGGGVWAVDVTLSGGRIENNTSVHSRGGGLYADRTLTLTNTQFISNSAAISGGGAHVISTTTALNGWFEGNRSNDGGGGGGLRAGQLIMTDTVFKNNVALNTQAGGGGAIVVNGVSIATTGAAMVSGGLFEGNVTDHHGGGLVVFGPLAMNGTRFIGNVAQAGGGLALERDGGKRVTNTLFARNVANGRGAGVYVSLTSGRVDLLHTTIASPTLGSGAGIGIDAGSVGVTNTIVASYAIGIENVGGAADVDYDLLFADTLPLSGTIGGGAHNVNGDPAFVAPAGDDYHLTIGSAAIDHGASVGVPFDLDGRARVGVPDIGADEFAWSVYLPLLLR
jgi:predicted outer membrane repeat protein